MSAEGWAQATALFNVARKLRGEERAKLVEEACRQDPALRELVQALLDAAEWKESSKASSGPATQTSQPSESDAAEARPKRATTLAGRRIGTYLLVREIGQGGMGAVYLAVRDDGQFDKRVAIKLLRPDSIMEGELVKRFRRERQILASLDHEYIARLLDGGTYDGLPYLVMEFIDGQTINHYCEARRLSIDERLELFIQVCEAVQYAHRNLVVHRDIKPGNIVVTARGVPKLLDFGIAKLLNPDLARDQVAATGLGIRAMTPYYASPEQVRGEPITTATDVYSLGVLLYELVSGLRPYRVRSETEHEIAQAVCEQQPELPSTALRRMESDATERSAQHGPQESGPKLRRRLAGDIDNIVLMALRKEPQRRYGSVEQLALDVQRHLKGLPVAARPDTFGYRFSKFILRNKTVVAFATLAAVGLLAGAVTATWQAREATRARARAEARFEDVRQLASSFLFEFHDAIENLPGATPARELIVTRALEYLNSLASESGDDPALQLELAAAYEKVGFIQWNRYYSNLGDLEGSLTSQRDAQEIRAAVVSADPSSPAARVDLARSHVLIGDVLFEMNEAGKALEQYRQSKELREAIASGGADRSAQFALAVSYERIGDTLGNPSFPGSLGDVAGADAAYDAMQTIFEALVRRQPTDTHLRQSLSIGYEKRGDMKRGLEEWSQALEYYQRALAIRDELVELDPVNTRYRRNLAIAHAKISDMLAELGRGAEALGSQQRAVSIFSGLAQADDADARAGDDLTRAQSRLNELDPTR